MSIALRPADVSRHLVTRGNLGFVANNTDLYRLVKEGSKFKKIYNVAPGQLVAWKNVKNFTGIPPKTVTPASLTVGDLATLRIGVGYSTKKNGIADAIRQLTPSDIEGCKIDLLDAVAPQCAVPQIKALYPECVSCDTTSVRVRVYDNESISLSEEPLKAYKEFIGSYTPDCATCTDCDRTVTCDEVVCGLVDSLNGFTDLRIQDGSADGYPYPNYIGDRLPENFTAFKLFPTWKSYCISPVVGTECTECNSIAALTTFTVGGVTHNFNLTKPSDNTKTLIDQLETAVTLMNEKLEETHGRHFGKVFLSRGEGKCCPLQIFASVCDATFAIAGLTECTTAIDQFPDFIKTSYCKQCGSNSTTDTPSCGIGIFVAPDYESCDCFIPNVPKQFNSRWVDVDFFSGSGNTHIPKYSRTAELLAPKTASGFGSQIQWLEYSQTDPIGFEGFQYEIGNETSGYFNLPEKQSRIRNAITANCETSYCSYKIQTRATTEYGPARDSVKLLIDGNIHVPQNDTVTKTDVEAFYQKVVDLLPGTCEVVSGITCSGTVLT
jgi:hypothetical protein